MKISTKRSNYLKIFMILIIAIAFAIISFADYFRESKTVVLDNNFEYMQEITKQMSNSINERFEENVAYIQSTAFMFSKYENLKREDYVVLLKDIEKNGTFDHLRIFFPDGKSYSAEGEVIDISERDYFREAMNGNSGVSEVIISKFQNEEVMLFYAPIIMDGKVVAGVGGLYNMEAMREKISVKIFDVQTDFRIIQKNGDIEVATYEADYHNVFGDLNRYGSLDDSQTQQVKNDFENGKSGHVEYLLENGKTVAFYEPLKVNGWMLYNSVPYGMATASATSIVQIARVLSVRLLICFTLLVFSLLFFQIQFYKKNQNWFHEKLKRLEAEKQKDDLENSEKEEKKLWSAEDFLNDFSE